MARKAQNRGNPIKLGDETYVFLLNQVFSHDLHHAFAADLEILAGLKTLKYFFNVPLGAFFVALDALYATTPVTAWWAAVKNAVLCSPALNGVKVKEFLKENEGLFAAEFTGLYEQLEAEDPHAVYPTNIYR